MGKILQRHKILWEQKQYIIDVVVGVVLFAAGIFANYWANLYTTLHASNSVTDLILDHLPTINVDFIFSEGVIIFAFLLTLILLYEPKRIPFVLKSVALFIIIRSAFMTLTHMAPPLHESYVDPNDFIQKISFGDDLFFSGHTGLPFLFAIIFWRHKYLRYFFLIGTLVGGVSVLLGHLHYSIDVFSALFISFGIFHISKWLFPDDYELLNRTDAPPTS